MQFFAPICNACLALLQILLPNSHTSAALPVLKGNRNAFNHKRKRLKSRAERATAPVWYQYCNNSLRLQNVHLSERCAMRIELCCPACHCRFTLPPEFGGEEALERVFDEGPRYALGDGETFEDMIHTTLAEQGATRCPACGVPVSVSEESLGQLAMTMLARM
jgi:hypothetical protein